MLLTIIKYGSSTLKSPGKPVDFFNAELEKIAQNMIDTCPSEALFGFP